MRHRFAPSRFYNAFGPYEPVLHVSDGDTLVTTTLDARGADAAGTKVAERGNPLTGPRNRARPANLGNSAEGPQRPGGRGRRRYCRPRSGSPLDPGTPGTPVFPLV